MRCRRRLATARVRWRTVRCVCRETQRLHWSSSRVNPSKDLWIARLERYETPHRRWTAVVLWRWRSRPGFVTAASAGRHWTSAAAHHHLRPVQALSSRSASVTHQHANDYQRSDNVTMSTSFLYQFFHFRLTYFFTRNNFFLFWFTTLYIHNSFSLSFRA